MFPEYDRKSIRQGVLDAIEPSQPDLADRVLAAALADDERHRDTRAPWLLSAAAVLLTGALVAALVFGTRMAARPSHQARVPSPSPAPSQAQAGPALGAPTDPTRGSVSPPPALVGQRSLRGSPARTRIRKRLSMRRRMAGITGLLGSRMRGTSQGRSL